MHKGFILVEWMIQFLLCTLIGMIAFTLFRTWSVRLGSLHRGLDAALQLPSAYDVLRRDLQVASSDMIEIQSDRCRISKPGQQIIWRFKNDTLFRSQKNYDAAQKKWRKSVQNVAAEKLTACSFAPLYNDTKNAVITGLQMKCGDPACEYIIGLRNGNAL